MNLILSSPADVDLPQLEQRAAAALAARTCNNPHYTTAEIAQLEQLNSSVLPRGFELSLDDTETLRALAKFSQTTLRPAAEIRSHRPYIGRLIVALKRLSWPLVQLHLKDTIAGIREFNSRLVVQTARQMVELQLLRKCVLTKTKPEVEPICDRR